MEQIYLQVLGTGSPSLAPSLLLFFPNQRYLINVPPSTTRALQSHRLLRLLTRKGMFEHVFLTDVSVPSIGGLPGFLLTIADSRQLCPGFQSSQQQRRLWVHSVAPLVGVACALRFFVRRRDFQLGCRIWRSDSDGEFGQGSSSETTGGVAGGESRPRKRKRGCGSLGGSVDNSCFRDKHLSVWPLVMDLGPKENCDELSCHQSWPPEYPRLNFSGGERARKRRKKMIPAIPESGQQQDQLTSRRAFVPPIMEIDVEGRDVQQISPSEAFGHRWSVAYLFKINDFKGKFDPEKAVQLGVFGRNRGLLARGQSATLDSGRIVRPEEVVGPPRIGTSFLVVCCRSTDDIERMVSCFEKSYSSIYGDSNISFVIHLCPDERVCRSLVYLDRFVGRFLPSVRHVLVTRRYCGINLGGGNQRTRSVFWQSDVIHEVLSGVDPIFFPFHPKGRSADSLPPLPEIFIPVGPLQKIILNPTQGIVPPDQELVEEVMRKREASIRIVRSLREDEQQQCPPRLPDQALESFDEEERQLSRRDCQGESSSPRVVFLGTGAAMPSKYRNVASILLDLPEDQSTVLLDCGEGTVGQIWRLRGQGGLEDVLRRLRLVWISHMHADHHVGLMELLRMRKRMIIVPDDENPLLLVGPSYMDTYLRELDASLDSGIGPYSFFDSELFLRRSSPDIRSSETTEEDEEGLIRLPALFQRALPSIWHLESVRVIHPSRCYGLVLKHRAGWSLVYSGDTMPCEALVRAGRNATILIHEGSFGDDEVALARAKKHSTIGEALDVARRMNAKAVMVTHFSQRYLKIIPKKKKKKKTTVEEEERSRVVADVVDFPTDVDDRTHEPVVLLLDEEIEVTPREAATAAPAARQIPAILAVDLVEIPFHRVELFPRMMPLIEAILRQEDEETEGENG